MLPSAWSHGNPVDILGDADPGRYARAVELVAADPNSDGLLVILTPQAMTDPTRTAEDLKPYAQVAAKPLLASWMGGADVAAGESILNRAGIPTFPYPDTAARMFTSMWRYSDNLRLLYETPMLAAEGELPDPAAAGALIEGAHRAGRVLLTEVESKQLLAAYGIPTVPTRIAGDAEAAARAAAEMGFPVVVKLHSETITHKSDVDGVKLGLADADAVRAAWRDIEEAVTRRAGPGHFLGVTVQPMVSTEGYELIVGSSIDAQFGPVLLFGAGGRLVEVLRDRALGLPPLTSTLARRMMEQTRIYQALQGVRGQPPVDLPQLEQLLVRVSQLVVEQPRIKELDINPLLASAKGLVALDARVVLHPAEIADADLPQPAIRPYPRQYVWNVANARRPRPHHPPDPPGGRAPHRRVPRHAVGSECLHALPPLHPAAAARGPRAAHADLLHRLRPRDGPGRRGQRVRLDGAARSSAWGGSASSTGPRRRSSPCS